MFAKLAEKLNQKTKDTEEEIKFKDYDTESEQRTAPRPEPQAPQKAPSLSATATEKDSNIELKVAHPSSFADVADIADYLLDGCTVVLNMEAMERSEILRMLDFLNGVTYTTGGDIKSVAQSTYIITPHNVDVTDEE